MTQDVDDPVITEALNWFVRLRDAKLSESDRWEFEAWLAKDEAHDAALRHAEALWKRFDIAQPEFDKLRHPSSLSRRNLLLGSLAIAAGGAGFYAAYGPDVFVDHRTAVGERRTISLADQSTVELGSNSALSVAFTGEQREVVLHRGEGFFDVAPDGRRPFIVRAAGGITKALGTRFDIKYVDNVVTVSVIEHAVTVEAGSSPSLMIDKGWQVCYDESRLSKPSPANLESVEAWRRDRLVFDDVPLRRVLAELDRYRRGRIVLLDNQVGKIAVTAIFDTKQVDAALRTIADTLPVRIFHATDFLTFVSAAG